MDSSITSKYRNYKIALIQFKSQLNQFKKKIFNIFTVQMITPLLLYMYLTGHSYRVALQLLFCITLLTVYSRTVKSFYFENTKVDKNTLL